jgi:hypothetical protein
MSDFKATPEQWANQEIWAQSDDDSACILELRARVEALEAAQRPRNFTTSRIATPVKVPITRDRDETGDHLIVHDTPAPSGSLVERVAAAIADNDAPVDLWHDDARAAI